MNKKYYSILNAAVDLFLNQGIKKTTMDEVAEEASASKVTVYKYFKDKDNLLRKVNESLYNDYLSNLRDIKKSQGDIRSKIIDTLNEIMDFIECGNLELCNALEDHSVDIKNDNVKNQVVYKGIITELIDEGKAAGIIGGDIKSDYIFYYIDMSTSYYLSNKEYRYRINSDTLFQKGFLNFFIGNIFIDTYNML